MSVKAVEVKLGELVEGPAGRDAVHVAVAPVEAAMELRPGDHVGLDSGGRAILGYTPGNVDRPYAKCLTAGIVDPYLTKNVKKGERFWLCLYPGTVTSLRHVWTHPAFAPQVPKTVGASAEEVSR